MNLRTFIERPVLSAVISITIVVVGIIGLLSGFCNEVLHLYLAKDLTMGETNWDPDEYVELEYFTLPELLEAIKAEQIKDSKSLAALMLAMPYLK